MFFHELMPIFALYREAKNSPSNFYRFFCYYKILEGIFKKLRAEVRKEAKQKGKTVLWEKETVPDLPELHENTSPYSNFIGKSINELFDNELTKRFRDEVAHFSLKGGVTLNPSSYTLVAKFDNIIYLMEICCRIVIENQENYYKQIRAK